LKKKIIPHLLGVHADETDVIKYNAIKDGASKSRLLQEIKNKGNQTHKKGKTSEKARRNLLMKRKTVITPPGKYLGIIIFHFRAKMHFQCIFFVSLA